MWVDEVVVDKYCLPDNLLPLWLEKQHHSHGQIGNYQEAARMICRNQIKWLLRNGWKPPEYINGGS